MSPTPNSPANPPSPQPADSNRIRSMTIRHTRWLYLITSAFGHLAAGYLFVQPTNDPLVLSVALAGVMLTLYYIGNLTDWPVMTALFFGEVSYLATSEIIPRQQRVVFFVFGLTTILVLILRKFRDRQMEIEGAEIDRRKAELDRQGAEIADLWQRYDRRVATDQVLLTLQDTIIDLGIQRDQWITETSLLSQETRLLFELIRTDIITRIGTVNSDEIIRVSTEDGPLLVFGLTLDNGLTVKVKIEAADAPPWFGETKKGDSLGLTGRYKAEWIGNGKNRRSQIYLEALNIARLDQAS